jgi:proteasome lid subunit RPN8/RPN11
MPLSEAIHTEFAFHIEYVNGDGRALREQRLRTVDFGHAIRHTRFDAFRRGLTDEYQPVLSGARIEPVFLDPSSSSPRAKGFCVNVPLADGREHACDFDIKYFSALANRVRAELQRANEMSEKEELYYRLSAFLNEDENSLRAKETGNRLQVTTGGVVVGSGRRQDFRPAEPWDNPSLADLSILVDLGVMEEIVEEAKSNSDREVAGYLLGHVQRDEDTQKVFVVVTGLASASGTTEATGTSVTYTPASFVQVRQIMKLRAAGESVIGWYHSHPFKLCAECPLPTPPECIAKVLFYSVDDVHLMETTFEQPFMVGLLAAVDPRIEQALGHPPLKLYGWDNGQIKARGFDVVRVGNR